MNHPLWSHSYLGYGFDVVQTKVKILVKQLALVDPSDALLHPAQLSAALAAAHSNSTASGQQEAAAAGSTQPGSLQHSQVPAVHVGEDGVVDPCLPAGYKSEDGRVGSGVWQQCQQLVETVIDPASCKPLKETPCPELPDNMPKLTGGQQDTGHADSRAHLGVCQLLLCVHEACCRLLMWSTVGSVVWEQGHCIKTAQQQALPTGQHAQVLHALQHLSRQHYL